MPVPHHSVFTNWMDFLPQKQGVFSTESKVPICIALYHEQLASKALRLARVNEGSYSFTCHPQVYPQVE